LVDGFLNGFTGWRQCAAECVVCPVRGSPVRSAEGMQIFFPDSNTFLWQQVKRISDFN